MLTDKQVKSEFRKKAWAKPEEYYATGVLKEEGFSRKICNCCKKPFWTVIPDQKACGDPACSGGFKFIGNTPAKNKMDYVETWNAFAKLFKKWGYTPIPRYPVVARWRDDTEYVQASIFDFQPHVVSGEVEPPANPLVVPQFCLRFNDIDNVGITGAHFTGFVMIGQHAFMPKEKWDQAQVFRDIHNWLKVGLGLPNEEITFHEDAWAGGGNFGPCMEYFSRGLELGNQVYMLYEQTPSGNKDLKLKVLDMGMGHERNAWFSQGTSTAYETTFPTVVKKLYKTTGLKVNHDLVAKFLPYSSFLNVDEIEDAEKVWKDIASKLSIEVKELKEAIIPLSALYSAAEHSRALLVALSDGALPSNVGFGYNLRIILRRALSFIDKYGWDVYMPELCREHASYLKPLFPELMENLDNVEKILNVEKNRYENTKQKSRNIISQLADKDISEDKLLNLYDSEGIQPELIKEELEKEGKSLEIPADFYAKVAELHEKKEQVLASAKEEKLDLDGVAETECLYFDNYEKTSFKAKVVKVIDNKIILDKTLFYPTSGGQMHDTGTIQNEKVVDVLKQGNVVVHVLESEHKFPEGEEVECHVDLDMRKQLTQHHTATHIISAAARRVLGNHINQAGAKKTHEKAHIDITHYQALSEDEEKKIEEEANKIVQEAIPIRRKFYSRNDAEKRYGLNIYQGGAVPGKKIRIVEIPEIDIEACAGTHLNNTNEAQKIKILKATKIQDGVVRIMFTAGGAASKEEEKESGLLEETAKILGVKPTQVPARSKELFEKWKIARKAVKKKQKFDVKELELTANEDEKEGNDILLEKTAQIFNTQPEHVPRTAKRFLDDLEEFKKKLG